MMHVGCCEARIFRVGFRPRFLLASSSGGSTDRGNGGDLLVSCALESEPFRGGESSAIVATHGLLRRPGCPARGPDRRSRLQRAMRRCACRGWAGARGALRELCIITMDAIGRGASPDTPGRAQDPETGRTYYTNTDGKTWELPADRGRARTAVFTVPCLLYLPLCALPLYCRSLQYAHAAPPDAPGRL
jgi:hypothetical protein